MGLGRKVAWKIITLSFVFTAYSSMASAASPAEEELYIRQLLTNAAHAPSTIDLVAKAVRQNREGILSGSLAPGNLVVVDKIRPISAKTDLNLILEGGEFLREDHLPFAAFTKDSFPLLVDWLWDPEDVSRWIRDEKGHTLSGAELKERLQTRKDERQKWSNKAMEFEKKFGGRALEEWSSLFENTSSRVRFPSRELYRKLFVDCGILTFYKLSPKETQQNISALVWSTAGEIILLTQPSFPKDVLLQVKLIDGETGKSSRYFLPSIPQIAALGTFEPEALNLCLSKELTRHHKTADLKGEIQQLRRETEEMRRSTEEMRRSTEEMRRSTEETRRHTAYLKNIGRLLDETGDNSIRLDEQLKSYEHAPTENSRLEIYAIIKKLRSLKKEIDLLPNEKYLAGARMNLSISELKINQFLKQMNK